MSNDHGILNPDHINLAALASTDDGIRAVTCFIDAATNEYEGSIGVRVSSLFVVLIVSSACTFFPVIATRVQKLRIPLYVYLFARYFGAGVIVATAFIQ